jgi:hypothetical protein
MHALGGTCSTLATIGDALVSSNRIHVFKSGAFPFGGAAPVGAGSGPNAYMVISTSFTDVHYDRAHATKGEPYRRTLQEVLAHELDHLAGQGHADPGTYTTPNSEACGA